jgi:hypothetical protein
MAAIVPTRQWHGHDFLTKIMLDLAEAVEMNTSVCYLMTVHVGALSFQIFCFSATFGELFKIMENGIHTSSVNKS